ncbi:MAG: hypothetical protein IT440_09930, partial [Phycisphaeraceae bacterium]|nr:hypothetical protein [Phycisphaeraceae bacterium]
YVVDAGAPHQADIPFRSTAKQMQMVWIGRERPDLAGPQGNFSAIHGQMQIVSGWPVGRLTHGLSGPLSDLLVIYCPGNGEEPWVWRLLKPWPGNQVLQFLGDPSLTLQTQPIRMIEQGGGVDAWNGYLWVLMGNKPLMRLADQMMDRVRIAPDEVRSATELLSFYSTLPPPKWWEKPTALVEGPTHFVRTLGRGLDITPWLAGPRLILIGYLSDSPLPMPLEVDGRRLPSRGWTVVRWSCPLTTTGPITTPTP